jgi:membrane protein
MESRPKLKVTDVEAWRKRVALWLLALRTWPWIDTARTLKQRFREDHLGLTAGSLTFTTLISLVPLVTVMLAVFSAFPMFATAAWLLWVLSAQSGADGVVVVIVAAIVLSFGIWLAPRIGKGVVGRTVAVLVIVCGFAVPPAVAVWRAMA